MLRVLINFFGSAHLREIRFDKESLDRVTIGNLKSYLPDQKYDLLLVKVNNTNLSVIMQDNKTIGSYIRSYPSRVSEISNPSNSPTNDVDVIRILGLSQPSLSSSNDKTHLQDLVNSKSVQSFLEKLKIRTNLPLFRESMRLKDIRMMKLTRREEELYLKYLQVEKPSKPYPTNLTNMLFSSIREDPLPFIF